MKIDLVDKSLVRSNTPKHAVYSVVVNTFFQVSRPRPRPLLSGLETETET